MVTNMQFAAVAAYLLWCLCASLSDRFALDEDEGEDESYTTRSRGRCSRGVTPSDREGVS
jgi:hypothetical protein